MLAEFYRRDVASASRMMVVTTILSLASVPAWKRAAALTAPASGPARLLRLDTVELQGRIVQ